MAAQITASSPAPGTAGIARWAANCAWPETYANTPKPPATSTLGMIASPSRPSVRFTALEKPTIQKYATTTKPTPSGIATTLSKGRKNVVLEGASAVKYSASAAAMPNTDCIAYLDLER